VHVLIIERNPGRRAIERLLTKKGFTYVREQRGILAYTVQLVCSNATVSKKFLFLMNF
jgi:hypothetical protein